MAFRIALSLLLLVFCTSPMLLPSLVKADQVEHASKNGSMISSDMKIPVEAHTDTPTAFPLPVTSYGLYWWIYSSEQIREYGESFRALPYVMSYSLPLDPKRIWPRVPLEKIGDLKWNETLENNPRYSPQVKEYLKDWYETLVEAFKTPDSQKILDYFANEKSFTYIQHPSDVQSIIRERASLASKYTSWRQPEVESLASPLNSIANNTLFHTRVLMETETFHDSTITKPSDNVSRKNSTINETSTNNLSENAFMGTESTTSDGCIEDEFEEEAPSLVSRLIGGTLSGAKEFEARAVNFFYRLAMNAYLANEEKAKDAIKCILGLDCNVPSFIKGMLQEQGFSILVRGTCTPGSCSEETEEIARTFRDQLAATYPALFNATLDLIRDLGSQDSPMKGATVTKLPH